jgi:hypothetical protein
MPLPKRNEDESRENFMSRCMSSDKSKKEFPDQSQRAAVCMSQAMDGLSSMAAADFKYNFEELGYTEALNEDNFYVPAEAEYEDWGEEPEEWDISTAKPGLWENIRKKKQREGDDYKPAKRGDPDRPDPKSWKKAQKPKKKSKSEITGRTESAKTFKYQDPKTGEIYEFARKGVYTKNGRTLIPAYSAEYQGRKVTLNKPFRTPDGPKKFAVYTKNGSGKVVIVRFGDPNMEIKKDNPKRRKSFRARHKCDTAPGPKWKARYWSCRMW